MPDLLPPNATRQERAISETLDRLPEVPLRTLWSPQTCPEAQLPWLASALSVDDWDAAWPVETKRQVIADSVNAHRSKGTVGALRRALQRLGYEVEINEATGQAYTFQLRLKVRQGESAGGAVAGAALQRAIAVTNATKNVRSALVDPQFFAEGGAAGVYVGGVTVSGAEVEIGGGEPTPLPLDGYDFGLVGSYWSVRMNSKYRGPIARVKRYSDGAELDYSNIQQLRDFIDGELGWGLVGFYNQTAEFGFLSRPAAVSNVFGELDSNGIPRQRTDNYAGIEFEASTPPIDITAMTAIAAGQADVTNGFQGFSIAARGENPNNFAGVSTSNAGTLCLSATRSTSNKNAKVIAGRAGGGTATAYDNTLVSSTVSSTLNKKIYYLSLGATDSWEFLPYASVYGGAFWSIDLGGTQVAALIAAIRAKLEL